MQVLLLALLLLRVQMLLLMRVQMQIKMLPFWEAFFYWHVVSAALYICVPLYLHACIKKGRICSRNSVSDVYCIKKGPHHICRPDPPTTHLAANVL